MELTQEKPDIKYGKGLRWDLVNHDWSNRTIDQIAMTLGTKRSRVAVAIYDIKRRYGYQVPHKPDPVKKEAPVYVHGRCLQCRWCWITSETYKGCDYNFENWNDDDGTRKKHGPIDRARGGCDCYEPRKKPRKSRLVKDVEDPVDEFRSCKVKIGVDL